MNYDVVFKFFVLKFAFIMIIWLADSLCDEVFLDIKTASKKQFNCINIYLSFQSKKAIEINV
jgi:23S rRNA C2498 (ribose-2'-O)-methylase RlmM